MANQHILMNPASSPIKAQICAIFIPVSNIEAARDWYCDLLGITADQEILHGHLYIIATGSVNIILDSRIYASDKTFQIPAFHFNTADIHAAFNWAQHKKATPDTDIRHGHWFNCKDPDGNVLMICQC